MTPVSQSETVTRFLLDKSNIRKDGSLHWRAVMPDSTDNETSVFRIDNLSMQDIWSLGDEKVARIRTKVLVGRGDLIAADVYYQSLKISPDNDDESKHAAIVGWPTDKHAKRQAAIDLAAYATAVPR
jgi:hypothetical protein